VVQQDTQGPYAESSSLRDDVVRSVLGLPGRGARCQRHLPDDAGARASAGAMCAGTTTCAPWWSASSPGSRASQATWWPGRHITRSHYEAVADVAPGFALGERIRIRRHDYTVVGLTRRMVSSGGDPMVFIPLKDAQEAQFLKDNDAIVNERARTAANPA
jgi:putative ABC transport system permease protein